MPGGPQSKLECQEQQCAEEECDPDECGDEKRGPKDDNFVCGIDKRPLLPALLILSTALGGLQMMVQQFPMLRQLLNGAYGIRAILLIEYVLALGCMIYCALCDPGQLKRNSQRKPYSNFAEASPGEAADFLGEDVPIPRRAHKMWLYALPIRRYDHYCRWLTNCIGLLNHREFVIMCISLVSVGVLGAVVDICLLLASAARDVRWTSKLFLFTHLVYSMILTGLAGPILRLHIGFISRNELANEWKKNEFYIIQSARTGKTVPVSELSDEEFNERFDSFQYDHARNAFDQGVGDNCWAFWCTPRWNPEQLGEF